MAKYFKDVNTLEELRKQYRDLLKKYHPDNANGSTEATQEINIEIVGCWIWVDGNTYAYKTTLKETGFKWAREKKKWYFHTEAFRKKSRCKLSMEDIRNYYGSTEVQTETRRQLKQA